MAVRKHGTEPEPLDTTATGEQLRKHEDAELSPDDYGEKMRKALKELEKKQRLKAPTVRYARRRPIRK